MHSEYSATQEGLRVVFCTQFQRLHLQAYVLTGCPKLAVDCVLEAFDTVSDSFVASPEFAYEASKLATVRSGLRRVLPAIKQHALNESMNTDRLLSINSGNETAISRETFLASLHRLDVFHRAVLLLCLYEGYRTHEVSLLLRLPRNTIQQGMIHALLTLVSSLTRTDADDLHEKDILPTAQPMQNMGRDHNSQTYPATAATCARSH
jgi:hypothetical protein